MEKKSEQLESRWAKVDGLSLHARVSNNPVHADELPIVLVHGLAVSSRYMIPTANCLAPYYRVYAPDLPGYGKSDKPSHIYTIPELSASLAAWMEAMGIARAILLGNSLGCQVIVNFALRYPEKIAQAILVGPTMDPKGRSIYQEAWRLLLDLTREPFSLLVIAGLDYLAAGFFRTVRTLQYSFRDPIEAYLPYVQVPTLVIRGERDPIVPQDWVERVHQLLPQSQLVVFPGAAHAVNFNSPEQLGEVVRAFLQEQVRASEAIRPPASLLEKRARLH